MNSFVLPSDYARHLRETRSEQRRREAVERATARNRRVFDWERDHAFGSQPASPTKGTR